MPIAWCFRNCKYVDSDFCGRWCYDYCGAQRNKSIKRGKNVMARNTDIPTEEELYDLAELFKVFGDSTRIRILFQLFDKELSVGELADLLNMNQSAVSHQLKVLKQAKLVKNRRDGKSIIYSLDDEHVRTIIAMGIDHIEE